MLLIIAHLIVLILLCLQAYRLVRRHQFAQAHGCQPAASTFPHNPWYLGYDYILHHARNIRARSFVRGFTALFDQLGPTYTIRVATKLVIHTVDPVNLKALLSTNNADYTIIPARRALVQTLFGGGVFGVEGASWIHSRALVRQGFSSFTYDQPTYKAHSDRLVAEIRAAQGQTIDFSALSSRFITDVVLDLYFGIQPGGPRDLADGFQYLANMGRSLTLFGRRIPYVADLFFGREFRIKKARVESLVDSQLRAAKFANTHAGEKTSSSASRTTFAQSIMRATDDVRAARLEMLNLMLAGNDSIAFLFAEIMWLLARHPDVWSRLRAEALSYDDDEGKNDPAADAIKRMPYLQCVLNECLRLRPTLSVHGRLSIRDTVLPRGGGKDGNAPLLVPASTYVVYSAYAQSQNAAIYGPDVTSFRPERWEHGLRPLPVERLSFGAGARTCLGERLAREISGYALWRLARAFERLEPRDDREWEEAIGFTFFNRNGTSVGFL